MSHLYYCIQFVIENIQIGFCKNNPLEIEFYGYLYRMIENIF